MVQTLTDAEVTVLMLCANGESLAAIGAWEKPIDGLVDRGLLRRHDKFNNVIEPAGRVALERHEKELEGEFTHVLGLAQQVADSKQKANETAEQAAQLLAGVARISSRVTGESIETAARRWAETILHRALALLA